MFSLAISIVAIALAATLIAVVMYHFNSSTEDAESDVSAAALITQGEQLIAAIDLRALDTHADLRQVDHLVTNKYLSSVPTPAKGTYVADVGPASPEDWRVLTRGMKPPILLYEKVNEATCLLVNSKSGYAGIMSSADPTRRIQCFGKSEPYSVLLNPTAKDWQRCETDPLLPGCTTEPPPPYCEVNPGAAECQLCVLEPHHSWCEPPTFCELFPNDPSCGPPEDFCKLYPLDPSCQPVNCKTQPTLPECKPFCERFPAHPDCLVIDDWCKINPDLEQCKPFCERFPEHPDCLIIDNWCEINPDLCKSYCEKYPEDPLCDKTFCEKYPDHPSCKPPRDFCDEFPTHELCIGGPGPGGPICEVVPGTVPCEFDASGSCVHDGYRYSTVGGVTYKCPEKPEECKITTTLLSQGSGYWLRYHIYRFAAQGGQTGGTVGGYVTRHATWEDAYSPAPSSGEWVKHVAIDPVYEVTNSCTGKCTLVDLELPVPPAIGFSSQAEQEAYQAEMAVYQSKLAEFRANKSRYTLIHGKYYDCGGGGPICTEAYIAEYVYANPEMMYVPVVNDWIKSTGRPIHWVDAVGWHVWFEGEDYAINYADFKYILDTDGTPPPTLLTDMPPDVCEPSNCPPRKVVDAALELVYNDPSQLTKSGLINVWARYNNLFYEDGTWLKGDWDWSSTPSEFKVTPLTLESFKTTFGSYITEDTLLAMSDLEVKECVIEDACLPYHILGEILAAPDDYMVFPRIKGWFDKLGMAWDAGAEDWMIRGTMTYDYLHERNSSMPESEWTHATEDYIPLPTWNTTGYVANLLHLYQVKIKTEGIPKICGY